MAMLRFDNVGQMTAWFRENSRKSYQRSDLLKTWKRWCEGTLPSMSVVLCDHRKADGELDLKEWDCGCSYGCDACRIGCHCNACGGSFENEKVAANRLHAWLTPAGATHV